MAEARVSEQWNHTSHVLCMIANAHRDPKKTSAFKPQDFNPFAKAAARRKDDVIPVDFSVLRGILKPALSGKSSKPQQRQKQQTQPGAAEDSKQQ